VIEGAGRPNQAEDAMDKKAKVPKKPKTTAAGKGAAAAPPKK
jgi:hypothetical protein